MNRLHRIRLIERSIWIVVASWGVFWFLSFAIQENEAMGECVAIRDVKSKGEKAFVQMMVKESTSSMEEEAKQSIGSARMEEDGAIVLQLRAEGPGGLTGDALIRYPPGHPEYNNILHHLGGLKKGEVKQVPPWFQK